jgi:hypothetical protein
VHDRYKALSAHVRVYLAHRWHTGAAIFPANETNVWLAEKCEVFGCLNWFLLCFSRGVRSS